MSEFKPWHLNPTIWINGVTYGSTLPDPEHHRFFTEPDRYFTTEPVKEHWLVRLFEWTVSKWLPKSN